MENQENKCTDMDVTKVYEYVDMSDKISGHCDNWGSVKFKSSVGGGKLLRKCTNCGMKKIYIRKNLYSYRSIRFFRMYIFLFTSYWFVILIKALSSSPKYINLANVSFESDGEFKFLIA